MTPDRTPSETALRMDAAALVVGGRTLWRGLDLVVRPGEFLAVLGGNGTGKTSLLKAILGLLPLTAGSVSIVGRPPEQAGDLVGYLPQGARPPAVPVRARDLVRLGVDGQRWGMGWPSTDRRRRVAEALADVGATDLADRPLASLSGGEQQRVRLAQALASDPVLLLCDEPLISLDLKHQHEVVAAIDRRRRRSETAIVFVTHEINPVLPYVDRVLYLANGRFTVGELDEVMTSASLTALYGSTVEVFRTGSRIIVAGGADAGEVHHAEPEPVGG